MKVAVIIGTRPEAIKMAPVLNALQTSSLLRPILISTGQHASMMNPVFELFGIRPDIELNAMDRCVGLNSLFSHIVTELPRHLAEIKPAAVLVHGDTTSAAAAAVAGYHEKIAVAHVEAGLRSGDMTQPWPEEANRRMIDLLSKWYFAPTEGAARNLTAEGVSAGAIQVTGNTVVDALLFVARRIERDRILRANLDRQFNFLHTKRPIVLATSHRRESFGDGIRNICAALQRLSDSGAVEVIMPVHRNPQVALPVRALLSGQPRLHLVEPLGYLEFVYLMLHSSVILTDSGGVQEEAPSLGKPVLVMRNVTERPEAVAAGFARLIGTDPASIVASVFRELQSSRDLREIPNPFGDGKAAQRIVHKLEHDLGVAVKSKPPHSEDELRALSLSLAS